MSNWDNANKKVDTLVRADDIYMAINLRSEASTKVTYPLHTTVRRLELSDSTFSVKMKTLIAGFFALA